MKHNSTFLIRSTLLGLTFCHQLFGQEGPNNATRDPSISDCGRFVAFDTRASNLYPEPEGGATDLFYENVFFMDRETRKIYNAQFTGPKEFQGGALFPQMSNDGEWVTFQSSNDFLDDNDSTTQVVVSAVRSRTIGVAPPPRFKIISRNAAGEPGNGVSNYPTISANGRFIAYMSTATNLTNDPVNGDDSHIFRHDRDADEDGIFDEDEPGATATILISAGGNGDSRWPTISSNGQVILFDTSASNFPQQSGGDVVWQGGAIAATSAVRRGLSPDGGITLSTRRIYAAGSSGTSGTFYRYRSGGSQTFGFPDNGIAAIASNGAAYILTTTNGALADNDNNGTRDVYLIDRANSRTSLISGGPSGAGNGISGPTSDNDAYLDMSRDARFIAYATRATDLGFADNNGNLHDVIIVDRLGETDRIEADVTPPTWSDLTLSVENVTDRSAELSWAPASDNGAVEYYRLVPEGENYGKSVRGATQTTFTGLKPSTTYTVRIEAYDYAGNIAPGPSTTFTTAVDSSSVPGFTVRGFNIDTETSVSFRSESGKTYRIEFSTNLSDWTTLLDGIPSEGAFTSVVVDSPAVLPDSASIRIVEE